MPEWISDQPQMDHRKQSNTSKKLGNVFDTQEGLSMEMPGTRSPISENAIAMR
jgi:hypothetical protein